MAKNKDNNVIKKRQPVWTVVKGILKIFVRKPKIISLSGKLPQKAIYLSNHSAMSGPLSCSLYMPTDTVLWGAYPMLGNYKMRYRYLRDVYFLQKRHKSKFSATVLAGFEAFFSIFFYRGMRVLPSYNDTRFITTIRKSIQALEQNLSIVIFPEDSNSGYHEKLTSFFAGFVELARYYFKKFKEELPIYPVYFHKKKNLMVIGNPSKLSDYESKGMSRSDIAANFCKQVNNLFTDHIVKA